jgi:hypothetical protein
MTRRAQPMAAARRQDSAFDYPTDSRSKGRGHRVAAIRLCKAIRPGLGCKRQIRRISRHAACFQPDRTGHVAGAEDDRALADKLGASSGGIEIASISLNSPLTGAFFETTETEMFP